MDDKRLITNLELDNESFRELHKSNIHYQEGLHKRIKELELINNKLTERIRELEKVDTNDTNELSKL